MISKKTLFIISAILFFAFILFSYLVAKEKFTKLDFDLTVKFQDHITRKLDTPFTFLSYLGSLEITGICWLLLTCYFLLRRYFLTALSMLLLPFALIIELFGKLFVLHPAPSYLFYRGAIDFNFPSTFIHTDYSYPSGHLTRTAFLLIFFITNVYLRKSKNSQILLIPIFLSLLAFMAISRIYLGEHWTTDVIGGILIGASVGLASGATLPVKKLLKP